MTTQKTYLLKIALASIFSLFLTILLIAPSQGKNLQNEDYKQAEPYRIENFDMNTPGTLQVRTSGGHIKVEGSNSDRVKIEMYVRKNGRELLPEDTDLDEWNIDISKDDNAISAIAKRKGDSGWTFFGNKNNVSISFVVYTPQNVSADLRTSGGHIDMKGLAGNQNISTSGGHLNLADLEGEVQARTSGGHIKINNITGKLDARTSGGHINVEKSEGKIRVKTSGGHINFTDVSGSVDASTSGGNIRAELLSVDQMVKLRTSGGNISIRIPESQGFDLDLRGSYVSTNLKNFSGEVDRNEVEGKLNGGGAKIAARTSGGTVSINFN